MSHASLPGGHSLAAAQGSVTKQNDGLAKMRKQRLEFQPSKIAGISKVGYWKRGSCAEGASKMYM